jgi:hypothetical protein
VEDYLANAHEGIASFHWGLAGSDIRKKHSNPSSDVNIMASSLPLITQGITKLGGYAIAGTR